MKIKRLLILFFMLFFIIFGGSLTVKAANKGQTYWNDTNTHNFTSDIVEEKELALNTTYIHDSGYTNRNGANIDQEIFILMQKSNASEGVKLVSWGGYNETHSVSDAIPRMTLSKIAEDYEKNHPGWKVLGGINADQYCWKYGSDVSAGADLLENGSYYPMKADGEYWFSHNFQGGNSGNVVGFLNDGNEQIVYNPEAAAQDRVFMLSVYDENMNLIKKFNIDDMNPTSKGTGVYTYLHALADTGNNSSQLDRAKQSTSKEISSTNDLYIVGNADKTWVRNSDEYSYFKVASNYGSEARDSFFGKGEITSIEKSTTINAMQFAIETTDSELLGLLKQGSYVIAQHEFYGGYENCESAIGWHTLQRYNGVDCEVANTYNSRGYPRSVVGLTEDGQMALITVEGTSKGSSNTPGLYAQEVNALCKAYNIKTAFQMDGGGSVTMILRNENGGFDTLNKTSDGSDRSIGNGLFFVVKDVEAEISSTSVSQNSVSMDVNVSDYGVRGNVTNTYLNVTANLNNGSKFDETYEVVDGKVVIDNLSANTQYTYKIQFKVEGNDKIFTSFFRGSVTTAKDIPYIKAVKLDKQNDDLKVYLSLIDVDKAVLGMLKISFDGGKTFNTVQANATATIKEFTGDPLENIVIKFYYDVKDGNGEQEFVVIEYNIECSMIIHMDSILTQFNNSMNDIFSE